MLQHRTIDSRNSRRGVALLAVLAVLALLTILVVAFLMRAQSARNAAANYRATTNTRLLADTVVNLVEAEINDATTYGSSSGASGTAPYTWASQPGAIRVYDSSGTAGAGGGGIGFQKLYRLYSAPSLTTSTISSVLDGSGNTTEIPGTWTTLPAQWVDLNAPVTVNDPSTSTSFIDYPILDNRNPSTLTQCLQLPGFFVNTLGGQYPTAVTTTLNPPVMPIQWLYVLQNGQLISPSSASGNTVSFSGSSTVPSASNPIVGRIAYWTDDDTCKINVNTAAGSVSYRTDNDGNNISVKDGVFFNTSSSASKGNAWPPASWDTPRYMGCWEDFKLFASCQPLGGEYQRYPGHPATTILYYTLRALGVNMPEIVSAPNNGFTPYSNSWTGGSGTDSQNGGAALWTHVSSLYGLLPRYIDNAGSQGGIADTTHVGAPANSSALNVPRSRLYTSIGEMLYATNATSATPPVRTQNGTLNGSATPGTPYLSRQQIESGKFFLTAHSRAPEVTLFGTPRVAMWPIGDTTQPSSEGITMLQTPLDKLAAFCSTTDTGTGGTPAPYYFQRYDRASTTNDWANESRNKLLYGYLQDLTGANIPGYATGSFLTKYSGSSYKPTIANERDQILTEIVDYIRCTNLCDHSGTATPTASANFYAPDGAVGFNASSPAQVMPLTITTTANAADTSQTASTTTGLGRLLTLSEVGIDIICTADGTNNLAALNTAALNPNPNFSAASNVGTSVAYTAPVTVAGYSSPVSPVYGSANDPAYVSNLPVAQFLRASTGTGSDNYPGTIVDIYGNQNAAAVTPFPANRTLVDASNPLPAGGAYGDALSALPIGSKMVQAMLVFELATPMLGYDAMLTGSSGPSVNIHVTNIQNIQFGAGPSSQFPTTSGNLTTLNPFPNRTDATAAGSSGFTGPNVNGNGYLNGASSGTSPYQWTRLNQMTGVGGIQGFRYPMFWTKSVSPPPYGGSGTLTLEARTNGWDGIAGLVPQSSTNLTDTLGTGTTTSFIPNTAVSGITPSFNGVSQPYRFISNPFVVASTTPATAYMTNSTPTPATISLSGSGSFNVALEMPVTKSGTTTSTPYQTFAVTFPSSPTLDPTLCAYGIAYSGVSSGTFTSHAPDYWNFDNRIGWITQSLDPSGIGSTTPVLGQGCVIRGDLPPVSWESSTAWTWKGTTTGALNTGDGGSVAGTYGDAFRSVVPKDCDYRVTMARSSVTVNPAASPTDFMATPLYSSSQNITNMLKEQGASSANAGEDVRGTLIMSGGSPFTYGTGGTHAAPILASKVPLSFSAGTPNPQQTFDWDSGMTSMPDGCYANKPDEGSNYVGNGVPYINLANEFSNSFTSYFTANRIVNSPVMFGSLPTGVAEQIPWRNLLLRPDASWATLTGLGAPEDELLLDNFWMPVVQPYAISEPFSTAGKINMNYQILPFTYITRSSALEAVLGSELVARAPSVDASMSTTGPNSGNPTPLYMDGGLNVGEGTNQTTLWSYVNPSHSIAPSRLPLNLSDTNGTLRQFKARFSSGDIFRSPAEICDIYLVPVDSEHTGNYTGWTSNALADAGWYGDDFGLVGNNVRDKPYGDIYPRLTTKSNSYTVYYRVQVLKNPPGVDPTQWTEGQGVITGEYRGSTAIERYLDPNNKTIPDYTTGTYNPAVNPSAQSLDSYYQWRTVSNTAFAP